MSNQEGSLGVAEEIKLTFPRASINVEAGDVPRNSIRDTVKILLDCKEKGKNLCNQSPPSIYMVPSKLRDQSPKSFEPQVVSIGPLHREDRNVQEMEEQKARYLYHLLDRLDTPPEQILESCLQKVSDSIDRIRACYAGIKTYTDVALAKMMVMDGCFILEFIFPSFKHGHSIFNNMSLEGSVFHDLVLLGNQIPFFVLQDIFDCTLHSIVKKSLARSILLSLEFLNPFQVIRNDEDDGTTPDHILGLLQRSFHPRSLPSSSSLPDHKQSVVELDKAGVKFKPNKDEDWQLAMEFRPSRFACFSNCWGNPTLKMPVLEIEDTTELVFRNIIAYEQCTPDVPLYFTSYAFAMDMLVNTTDDISKLVESKVIVNNLGSNEDAKNLINGICNEVTIADFYYPQQWRQLDEYYNGYWPKNIARLKRTYFNSPWTIIALLAAFILFALTILQTIFTIKPT